MPEAASDATDPVAAPAPGTLARGSLWVASGQVVAALCRLAVTVTSARLLLPADFGLFGLANLAITTLRALSETGVERAFVQRKDATGYADVAWTLLLGRALLLALVLLALAQPLCRFYDEPRLLPIFACMALSTLITGFKNVGAALWNRQLAFNKLFAIEAMRAVGHACFGLTLVLWLRNVWALVLIQVVNALVEVAVSYVSHPHRPKLEFDRSKSADLLRFGRWLTGMAILGLLVTRGDDMFISKYLGAEALGVYGLAYEIANLPTTQITYVLGRVSFPAYARLHDDADKAPLRAAFSRVSRSTILLSGAATVLIAACAQGLVEHVLGKQWRPAIDLIRILVVAGFVRSVIAMAGALFHAVGRPDLDFKMNLPRVVILTGLIWPACAYAGLVGASLLVLLAVSSALPTFLYGVREFTGYTPRELLRENAPALVVALVLALGFAVSQALIPGATALGFAAQVIVGLALAWAGLWSLDKLTPLPLLSEVRRLRAALRER